MYDHVCTHMATEHDNNHAAIPLRSATANSKIPYNYAHTQTHRKQLGATITLRQSKKTSERSQPAPASHSCPASSAAPTLPEKRKVSRSGFLPKTSPMQHSCSHLYCYVMYCCVMYCDVMYCCAMYCYVLLSDVLLCDVLFCDVLLCYVLLCDVLVCDVLLCYVLSCDVLVCDVLLCDVLLCDVLLCYV